MVVLLEVESIVFGLSHWSRTTDPPDGKGFSWYGGVAEAFSTGKTEKNVQHGGSSLHTLGLQAVSESLFWLPTVHAAGSFHVVRTRASGQQEPCRLKFDGPAASAARQDRADATPRPAP